VILLLQQPDSSFVEVQSTATDANGDYNFAGLPDGNYRVEIQPSGSVIDGFGQTGDPDLASDPNPELRVCDSPTEALCDDATTTPITLAGGVNVGGVDFGYQKDFVTTPVTVNQFSANRIGGGIVFNWETSNEVGHLGYQLFARTTEEWVLLNDTLITHNDADDAMQKRSYQFTATDVEASWFALVDVSAAEELTVHGPYKIENEYGELLVEPAEFDWSGIQLEESSSSELSSSVRERIRQAELTPANDDDFDSFDEDDDDDEFDEDEDLPHSAEGGER
jgi:hypothetical protein